MATKSTKIVFVGCKLPQGLVIEHPADPKQRVVLKGVNKQHIVGSGYGVTEVDGDFWGEWLAANKTFAPVVSGAIFAAPSAADVAALAADIKSLSTGFEPMRTDGKDPRAVGVKTATTTDGE